MSYTVVMYKLQLYACVCLGGGVWGVSAVVICKLQLYACVCRRGGVYMRACVDTVSSNKDDARASIFQDSPRIKPARYACMLVCLYAGISSGKIDGE